MLSSNTFAISQPVTTGASQTKSWSNAANTVSRLLALFPISLFTFQAREAYLTPIKNVKDGLGASHARFDTAMVADTWDGILKDMSRRRSVLQCGCYGQCLGVIYTSSI